MHESTPLLREYSRRLVREWGLLNNRLDSSGCSLSQCRALLELMYTGPMSLSELAEMLRVDPSTASRLVKSLEEKRLVQFQSTANDKRIKRTVLTDKGRAVAVQLDEDTGTQLDTALKILLPEEVEVIANGLRLYVRALRQARLQRDYVMRPIAPEDESAVARLIRDVMTEFGAVGEGFSIQDPEVDHMHTTYSRQGHAYYIIEKHGQILGAGGLGPLAGGEKTDCELKKMYFYPALRGLGLGKKLLLSCLDDARKLGYTRMYLETLERMSQASGLYEKMGFRKLDQPLGYTGHSACDAYYAMELAEGSDI